MTKGSLAGYICGALLVVAAVAGLTGVTANGDDCGSLIQPRQLLDTPACEDARSARRPIMIGAFGLAFLAGIAWRNLTDDEYSESLKDRDRPDETG